LLQKWLSLLLLFVVFSSAKDNNRKQKQFGILGITNPLSKRGVEGHAVCKSTKKSMENLGLENAIQNMNVT